jgi:hypothetical protein
VGLLLAAATRVGDASGLDADAMAAWLAAEAGDDYPGLSWGYPFDWHSRIFIPRGTPSVVVTSTCGQALLDHGERTGDPASLEAGREAARFVAEGLNVTEFEDGTACLSYTPLDTFQVHNASLMGAELLIRAARTFAEPAWEDLAARCLAFTVGQQRDDGSFEYWGDDQIERHHVDNYHTGFVLRSLHAFASAGVPGAAGALDAGWEYYRDRLLGEGRPRDLVTRDVPLNIHSCAESVLCPAVLAGRFPEALGRARAAAEWTVDTLQNPDGSFAWGIFGDGIRRVPFLRWGQAWMFRALTELLATEAEYASDQA